jgi:hypothetical protein
MELRDVLRQLDQERRTLAYEGMGLEVLPKVTRGWLLGRRQHWVSFSALDAETAEAAIVGEIEHHRRLGVGFEWKLFAHDRPADLRERLERHGFRIGAREAVMAYELAQRGSWVNECGGIRVERIGRVDQVEDYRRVNKAAYGENEDPMADELAEAIHAGSKQHFGYVAYADEGEPVSIGRLYLHPKSVFGGLYGGATAPAFRRRGYYKAVVAARARDAVEAGVRYLQVDALPTSRPILERLGFVWVTETWPCEWSPSEREQVGTAVGGRHFA